MSNFKNKSVLVTGAGSGIGATTALSFAANGANVCCADINLGGAQKTCQAIKEAGGNGFAVQMDVSSEQENLSAVEQMMDEFGTVDIAFLNAGIVSMNLLLDVDVDTWDRVMAVNLRGVFLGLKAVVPVMKDNGGGAVTITASGAGLNAGLLAGAYGCSKHGVVGLAKQASLEFAKDNIRVNAIAPGAINTPMSGGAAGSAMGEVIAKLHPIGRVGQPEEVASLVTYLSSDEASFITGAIVPVDGGVTAALYQGPIGDGDHVFD